jgi:two-component system nitrogen regulation sensor histidine kinase NtrY
MTDLVSAQRLAAWGDVARRVAHEIRNPLTPIQLSAERLNRKFGKQIESDKPVFDQCTATIVRQVEQIRRMVEEFYNFARMPKPVFADEPLGALVKEAAMLQIAGNPETKFDFSGIDDGIIVSCDRGLIIQALTNVMKNGIEAINARKEKQSIEGVEPLQGRIGLEVGQAPDGVRIRITDNGIGLPHKERKTVVEPYVTTKARGTGLGLAIVKRMVEEHGGTLSLLDAEPGPYGETGTAVELTLSNSAGETDQSAAPRDVA